MYKCSDCVLLNHVSIAVRVIPAGCVNVVMLVLNNISIVVRVIPAGCVNVLIACF